MTGQFLSPESLVDSSGVMHHMHQRASVLTLLKARKYYPPYWPTLDAMRLYAAASSTKFTRFNSHPIPYLRCFDTPLCIDRWFSTQRHGASPLLLIPSVPSLPANLRRLSVNFGELIEWTYRADTACHMTLALGRPHTFQHSKSGYYNTFIYAFFISIMESVITYQE